MIFILPELKEKKTHAQITNYLAGRIDDLSDCAGECSLKSQSEWAELQQHSISL